MKHIAIIDFGSQYTHLIARSIREMNVLAKIYHTDVKFSALQGKVEGVILSGGPQSVYDENSLVIDRRFFDLGVPVLGICYGHQLMAHLLGGKVEPGDVREYGRAKLQLVGDSAFFEGVKNDSQVWMSHGDAVKKLPQGFEIVGQTKDCEITAMADGERKFFGVQFHPEVEHSAEGKKMLENFVLKICSAKQDWKVENLVDDLCGKIRKQVGERKVFILVSGGVDSNVAFALLNKSLGKERVMGLYIDNGFMRLDESARLKTRFEKMGYDNLHMVDASETFLKNLENVFEPEEKRKIIGQTFLDIKEQEIERLGLNPEEWLLGQGTIYPDIIESGGTKNADKIKTHHNRVDAIKELVEKGLVVEPLIDFYKYEVRMIGKELALPDELVERHPFPGPGLGIRCLCFDSKKTQESLSVIQDKVDDFYKEKFEQISTKVLPIKSVGVKGDNRCYAHMLAVWGEGWFRVPNGTEYEWEKLDDLSSETTNKIEEINRVIIPLNVIGKDGLDVSLPKKDLYLSKNRLDLLRKIDEIVNQNVREAGIYDDIWQFPIILVPLVDKEGRESIALRPFNSRDVMTVHFYRMNTKLLSKIRDEILATGKISHVFFDITNKPPGTTEWE